jgi:hypothetical protein
MFRSRPLCPPSFCTIVTRDSRDPQPHRESTPLTPFNSSSIYHASFLVLVLSLARSVQNASPNRSIVSICFIHDISLDIPCTTRRSCYFPPRHMDKSRWRRQLWVWQLYYWPVANDSECGRVDIQTMRCATGNYYGRPRKYPHIRVGSNWVCR